MVSKNVYIHVQKDDHYWLVPSLQFPALFGLFEISTKICFILVRYSDVSIKNIDILPNRQYIANSADSAQEQYS